ncbi:MAG: protocatechuate 3,4-dioxygenase subunit alpha [Rhizobiales bacterium NRL2]|jgi:protocatechuate 3,4-dioxygenase alpha subunit|nr:MAG: protocatechuate 3,4-dioxygenase subunit alpha [Rhizobiales bacterium NRL2]
MNLKETASQTAGPFVHIGLAPEAAGIPTGRNARENLMAQPGCQGERIRIEGVVTDGEGNAVKDALIEVWQADAEGCFHHRDSPGRADPKVSNWGRCAASFEDGTWSFTTVKPGPTPAADGRLQAPHVDLLIHARGINFHLMTRVYFADEAVANAEDPLLQLIDDEDRRATLIAGRSNRAGQTVYRFDIRLQGEGETVFLDF